MNLEPLLKSVALAEARGSDLSMTPTEVRLLASELIALEAKIIEQGSRLDERTKERDQAIREFNAILAAQGELNTKHSIETRLLRDELKAQGCRLGSIEKFDEASGLCCVKGCTELSVWCCPPLCEHHTALLEPVVAGGTVASELLSAMNDAVEKHGVYKPASCEHDWRRAYGETFICCRCDAIEKGSAAVETAGWTVTGGDDNHFHKYEGQGPILRCACGAEVATAFEGFEGAVESPGVIRDVTIKDGKMYCNHCGRERSGGSHICGVTIENSSQGFNISAVERQEIKS